MAALTVQPSLSEVLGQRPAAIQHGLHNEPVLALDHLIELTPQLPESWVRRRKTPDGRDDDEVRLLHVELLPSIGALFRRSLHEADADGASQTEGGITATSAVLLIAQPGRSTGPHLDHHHNLLLQIRGTKTITVGWYPDPGRQRAQVERAVANKGVSDDVPPESITHHLEAGEGVYIPPYMFHWVDVGATDTSVAMACAFGTASTQRRLLTHRMNVGLSRLHLRPRPVGTSSLVDGVKARLARPLERRLPQA